MQGIHRRGRARRFAESRLPACLDVLATRLDVSAADTARLCAMFDRAWYRVSVVPGVDHDHDHMFHTTVGRSILFYR